MQYSQMKKQVQMKQKQAGMTLMELIASLAVLAVVVVGALALYGSATSSESSTSMIKDLTSIRAATQQLYQGQGTYGTAGTNLNDILTTAQKIPTTITVDTSTTPDTLTHKENGTVNIAAVAGGFTITLTNIPVDVCMPLMTSSQGWTSVKAGTATAVTAFPISPNTAKTDCSTGTTMVFTSN